MTGRRPFSELIKDWPPERRRRVGEGTARLSAEVEAAMAAERAGKRAPQRSEAERRYGSLRKSSAREARISAETGQDS